MIIYIKWNKQLGVFYKLVYIFQIINREVLSNFVSMSFSSETPKISLPFNLICILFNELY